MVLCSCGYSKKMHTKLSFAGYDKNQIVNVLLLSVSHSLSFSVQLGKLLFPFIIFFFFLEIGVPSALLALHHLISIFPKRSFWPYINEASPNQYLKD